MWTKASEIFRRKKAVLFATLLVATIIATSCLFNSVKAEQLPLSKRVEDAVEQVSLSNTAVASDFVSAVKSKLGNNYSVSVSNWYLIKSVSGCKDKEEVLFEGYNGFASGLLKVTYGDEIVEYPFTSVIRPSMMSYNFASTARCDYFYPDPDNPDMLRGDVPGTSEYFTLNNGGKNLVGYSGSAEKIVIPEGVTTMDQSWWLDTDLTAVRCIVLPESLTVLPDQFGVPFCNNIEVIVMRDNVTKADGWRSFRKCYFLKNLRLSDNLENLNEQALFECLSLGELKLPNKLKEIGIEAFHLSAFRDIVVPKSVTSISSQAFAWPLRKAEYVSEGVRTQGNAVPKSITNQIESFLHTLVFDSKSEVLPRTITILSDNAKYDSSSNDYWNTDYSWSPINIYYPKDSTTQQLADGGYKPKAVTYYTLNMDIGQVKGHSMVALETIPITASTTSNEIAEYVKSVLVSDKLGDITVSDYQYTAPSAKADGEATATVTVNYDGEPIVLKMDRKLQYHPAYELGTERREPEVIPDEKPTESEYLYASLETDRDEYGVNEDIFVTLRLSNISQLNVDNIRVSFDVPDELSVKSGSVTPVAFDLAVEEEAMKQVTLIQKKSLVGTQVDGITVEPLKSELFKSSDGGNKPLLIGMQSPSTLIQKKLLVGTQADDISAEPLKLSYSGNRLLSISTQNSSTLIISVIMALLCAAAIILIISHKNIKRRAAALTLCCVLLLGAIVFPAIRTTAVSERVKVSKQINVGGEKYTVSATVSFTLSEEAENDFDNNYTVDWKFE